MRAAGLRKWLEQHAEALAALGKAKAPGHTTATLRFRRGEVLVFNGRLDEAETEQPPNWVLAGAIHSALPAPTVAISKRRPHTSGTIGGSLPIGSGSCRARFWTCRMRNT